MLSFWEKTAYKNFDFIIIGAGISGLSTAISLKEKNPKSSVLVLERGILPTGASTKNAGFACFGSLTEILSDIKTLGLEKAIELIKMRVEGLSILKKRLGEEKLDYKAHGGYEVFFDEKDYTREIKTVNDYLLEIVGKNVFQIKNEAINNFGFGKEVKQMIFNPYEGQINTGMMMRNLWQYANEKGVYVINGAETTIEDELEDGVKVSIMQEQFGTKMYFQCRKLILCTNAFTKKLMPEIDITPGRGQVLITKPIENLKFKGIFHFDEGYYYFRNFGKQIIFGGGRNSNFLQENTFEFATTDDIMQKLKQYLDEVIIPNTHYEIEMAWSGIMAFGKSKFPIIQKHNKNIIIAARLSGMGIAIGSLLGAKAAALANED